MTLTDIGKEACLTIAANGYCEYICGVSMVAEQPYEDTAAKLGIVKNATEIMYSGAHRIIDAGAEWLVGGSAYAVKKSERPYIDEELSAFATEAVDIAFDRYLDRIRSIGVLSLTQEVIRPCVLSSATGAYTVRRSRVDKLTVATLAAGLMHPDFAELGRFTITQIRAYQ